MTADIIGNATLPVKFFSVALITTFRLPFAEYSTKISACLQFFGIGICRRSISPHVDGNFFERDTPLVQKIFAKRAVVSVDNVSRRTRPNRRKQIVIQLAVGEIVIRNAVVDAQQKFFVGRCVVLAGLAEINVVENFFAVDALIDKAVVVKERLAQLVKVEAPADAFNSFRRYTLRRRLPPSCALRFMTAWAVVPLPANESRISESLSVASRKINSTRATGFE